MNSFQIIHKGEPYYIKGAGGFSNLELLAKCGGNSIRIWDADNCEKHLDKALEFGLTVLVGLRMIPERHGFDYSDKRAVIDQNRLLLEQVSEICGHPAIIGWCVGNELDLEYSNNDVWDAVDHLADGIKKHDKKSFITTAVTGNLTEDLIKNIKIKCTSIDILSVNIYGTIEHLQENLIQAGWTSPYLITEWGVDGYWEVSKTDWDAAIEPTSSQKAAMFRYRYNNIIKNNSLCLGSYAFLWGQKQETTHTWFGLFLESGDPVESIRVLESGWKDNDPNPPDSSEIKIRINGLDLCPDLYLSKGESVRASVTYNGSAENIAWELTKESTDIRSGGDRESRPSSLKGRFKHHNQNYLDLNVPESTGPYRLFVTVMLDTGYAATANFPFFVNKSKG